MVTKNNFQLFKEIVKLSIEKINFDIARKEWFKIFIYNEQDNTCLCGHHPITECIIIQNIFNNNRTIIGNCCIELILDTKFTFIFNDLKKITKNINKSLSEKGINFYFSENLINKWEYDFCLDTRLKRELSFKQLEIRKRINNKILNKYKRC